MTIKRYLRQESNIEYIITQKGRLMPFEDKVSGGTNDAIVFMVEGGGKTYIPCVISIVPGLLYAWQLVVRGYKDQVEIEKNLLRLFILQVEKTIKENPEKLDKMHFTFKTK